MTAASTQWFLIISFAAGILIPYQTAINGLLSRYLQHPLQATLFNFIGGALFLSLLLLSIQPTLPSLDSLRRVPWYLFCGGVLGVEFVTASLLAVPRIGGTAFLAAMLTGQMAGALILDHFGLLNVPVQPISVSRLAGIVLLALGVYLVQRG